MRIKFHIKHSVIVLFVVAVVLAIVAIHAYAMDNPAAKVSKSGKSYVTTIYNNNHILYHYRTSYKPTVKFARSNEISEEFLKNRVSDHIIYIEVITGVVIDNNKNGRSSDGYYISYKRTKGARKGYRYHTYAIYNPYTTYTDDVIDRFDNRI